MLVVILADLLMSGWLRAVPLENWGTLFPFGQCGTQLRGGGVMLRRGQHGILKLGHAARMPPPPPQKKWGGGSGARTWAGPNNPL